MVFNTLSLSLNWSPLFECRSPHGDPLRALNIIHSWHLKCCHCHCRSQYSSLNIAAATIRLNSSLLLESVIEMNIVGTTPYPKELGHCGMMIWSAAKQRRRMTMQSGATYRRIVNYKHVVVAFVGKRVSAIRNKTKSGSELVCSAYINKIFHMFNPLSSPQNNINNKKAGIVCIWFE